MGRGILGMRVVPWSPDGSENAFDHSRRRDPLRWCLAHLEKCRWRTKSRGRTFADQTSNSGVSVKVVLGAGTLGTGQGRQRAHSEACRRRIEALLGGDSSESARLAATDERINRAPHLLK